MEFFKGNYTEKKSGLKGLFDNQEFFVMCTANTPSEYGLKTGMILDNYGLAKFTGIINQDEMHFVKMYNRYEQASYTQDVPTIQYNLLKRGIDTYSGNYIIHNTDPDFSSGNCTITKINKESLTEEIIKDGLKYADEDLIKFILKTIFKSRIQI